MVVTSSDTQAKYYFALFFRRPLLLTHIVFFHLCQQFGFLVAGEDDASGEAQQETDDATQADAQVIAGVFAEGEQGCEDEDAEGLAEFLHQGAGGEVHAFFGFAGFEGVMPGDIGQDGVGEYAEEGQRDGVEQYQHVGLRFGGQGHVTEEVNAQKDETHKQERDDHEYLFADFARQDVDQRIKDEGTQDHDRQQCADQGFRQAKQNGDVKEQAGVDVKNSDIGLGFVVYFYRVQSKAIDRLTVQQNN